MYTSRGCLYSCAFCSATVHWRNRIRFHSPEWVIEEIERIYDFSGTNYIRIEDLTFAINKEQLRKIVDLWKRHHLYRKIRFAVKARANHIDAEMADLLDMFGVDTVFIGFESNNAAVLADLKKKDATPDINQSAYDILATHNMTIYGSFIIGSPMETHTSVQDTIDFVRRNTRMYGSVCNLVPLPGTEVGS